MLQMHGMGINIRNWIGNWLHNRKQRVVNGVKSESLPVTSGVPQSSVLGPALFIYINDIDANVSSSVLKFADDIELNSNVCLLFANCVLPRMHRGEAYISVSLLLPPFSSQSLTL